MGATTGTMGSATTGSSVGSDMRRAEEAPMGADGAKAEAPAMAAERMVSFIMIYVG